MHILLRWINALVTRPRGTVDLHNVFADGHTLCLMLERLQPGVRVTRFNRAVARATALGNIEGALALVWNHLPTASAMPSAEQVLAGSPRELILRFIDQLYTIFVVRPARARLVSACQWMDEMLKPYGLHLSRSASTPPHTALGAELRSGAALAIMLHANLPAARVKDDLDGNVYWQPTTELERQRSIRAVLEVLNRERLAPCTADEFLHASRLPPAAVQKPPFCVSAASALVTSTPSSHAHAPAPPAAAASSSSMPQSPAKRAAAARAAKTPTPFLPASSYTTSYEAMHSARTDRVRNPETFAPRQQHLGGSSVNGPLGGAPGSTFVALARSASSSGGGGGGGAAIVPDGGPAGGPELEAELLSVMLCAAFTRYGSTSRLALGASLEPAVNKRQSYGGRGQLLTFKDPTRILPAAHMRPLEGGIYIPDISDGAGGGGAEEYANGVDHLAAADANGVAATGMMAAAAEEKAEEAEGVFGSSNGALLPDAASLLAEVDDYLGARRASFVEPQQTSALVRDADGNWIPEASLLYPPGNPPPPAALIAAVSSASRSRAAAAMQPTKPAASSARARASAPSSSARPKSSSATPPSASNRITPRNLEFLASPPHGPDASMLPTPPPQLGYRPTPKQPKATGVRDAPMAHETSEENGQPDSSSQPPYSFQGGLGIAEQLQKMMMHIGAPASAPPSEVQRMTEQMNNGWFPRKVEQQQAGSKATPATRASKGAWR